MKAKALLAIAVLAASTARADLVPIHEVFEPAGSYDPSRYGKVAVVQWAPQTPTPLGVTVAQAEAYKAGNRRVLEEYIREAARKGAELVVTPEFAILGYPDIPELPPEEDEYRDREDIRPYVEPLPGPTTRFFGRLAQELGIHIHVGFAEVDPDTDEYFNVVAALGPTGAVVARYRKMNLYAGEGDFVSPGAAGETYSGPFGKVGLLICADVYSSRPIGDYRRAGVDVLALSTSWAQWNTGMSTFRRAARDSRMHVVAANQNYFPDSGVINPDGTLQSHIRQTTGLAYGFLPRKKSARRTTN
jgi:predicted amidohydrolase